MTAPYYMLAPFSRHYDGGFGATAEAFHKAAESLEKADGCKISNGHLPIQFLYRHAIELYLKSMIVVISKRAAKLRGTTWSAPEITVSKGVRPIQRVHGIGDLYRQMRQLLDTEWPLLKDHCGTDWRAVPDTLTTAIEVVDTHDPAGTLLRYPTNAETEIERAKSSFEQLPLDKAAERVSAARPGVGLFFIDDDENVTEAFMSREEPLKELLAALRSASRELSGAHFGMRMELAGGW